MKLGYNTWSMPGLSLEDAATLCASLGFDSLEITVAEGWPTDVLLQPPGSARTWRDLTDGLGLSISSLTANSPIIVEGAKWATSRDRLVRSMDLAAQLQDSGQGMPISLGASFPRPYRGPRPSFDSSTWEIQKNLITDRLGELAALAGDRKVRVALEPHVFAVVSRPDQALFHVEAVGSDAFGLNLDISHFAVQGDETAEVVRLLGPHAIVAEVKDKRGVQPDFDFLTPGEGDFDFAAFVREMGSIGYEHSIAVEISLHRQDLPEFDPAKAAAASYAVMDDAFERAGVPRMRRSDDEQAEKVEG